MGFDSTVWGFYASSICKPNLPAMKTTNTLLLTVVCLCIGLSTFAHKRPALEFVENLGQWHENVLYRVNYQGGSVFLENGALTYQFMHPDDRLALHDLSQASFEEQMAYMIRFHAWKMNLVGSLDATIQAEDEQSYYYNYLRGNNPLNWKSNANIFKAVRYNGIYNGIDLRVYNRGANLKYDFILAQGADPQQIVLDYSGLDAMQLDDGNLVLRTSIGEVLESAPYAFQVINGIMTEVECYYVLEDNQVRFEFPNGYNADYKLTIDPELIAATLSGSTGEDNYGHTATFDIEGNIYTGCIAFGTGYPTSDGAFQESYAGGGWGTDIAISKLNPEGTELLWASYIGGTGGDYPHSLITNDFGEIFVYGSTNSEDFPVTSGAYDEDYNGGNSDIVIAHFSADGTELVGSTYIGGSGDDGRNAYSVNYGDTYRGEIILDPNNKPVIASFSSSDDFPTTFNVFQPDLAGAQDGVVCKLNDNLSNLETSTFLGSEQNDSAYGVRVASNGDIYVAGMAGADDFPVTAGAYQTDYLGGGEFWGGGEADGFVVILSATATTMIAGTYYGTEDEDQIFFIDLDTDENVYVYGQGGVDMPIIGDVYSNPNSPQFIAEFTADLSDIEVSTQIGGGTGGGEWTTYDMVPIAFLVDHCNNVYISSHNANGDLPLTADALYSEIGDQFYLAVLTEDLEDLEFGTRYTSNHVDGGTSRFDKNGTVYQAVCSGGGFATTADAWATDQIPWWDIGVFKIDFDVSGVNSAITGSDVTGCAPFEVQFSNFSVGDQFFWDFGDGTTSTEFEPSHIYLEPGSYEVSLIASDSLSCNVADTSYFPITISVPTDFEAEFDWEVNCEDMSITTTNLTGLDFLEYIWDMGDGTILEEYEVTYYYEEPGTYEVTMQAIDNGCDDDEVIVQEITIYDQVVAALDNDDQEGCAPFEADFSNNSAGVTFTWDFGDGSPLENGSDPTHIYNTPGEYEVTLIVTGNANCPGADTTYATVTVVPAPFINPLMDVQQIGQCELTTVSATNISEGDDIDILWDFGDGEQSTEDVVEHIYDVPGTYVITLTISEDICDQEMSITEEVEVIEALDLGLSPDASICYYDDGATLTADEFPWPTTYEWSTGETTQSIYVTEPGVYTVTATSNNCEGQDAITVSLVAEQYDQFEMWACEGTTTYVAVPGGGSYDYAWCTGEAAEGIFADQPGDYCYTFVDDFGCLQEGNIHLFHIDHEANLYIPNAFTPNNDGVNDVFQPVGTEVRDYEISVWNRWGDLVWQTNDQFEPWIGNYQGGDHFVQDGMYTYKVIYNGQCNAEKIVKVGYVVVLR